ncbi:cysteine and glycine-rich protein 2 [Elysia marginata]|uniref:Cysteine and glycine-rich protein 2 n=1 Tax=Elysia marginata TaxID=1093978 RepID=A0AAV4IJ29_9GAST|nr:cysteine and glycine-rich protein 2 [Elysia marginata]
MPFKPIIAPKCPKCQTSVYAAEERLAGGHKFHARCFMCEMCKKKLDSTTVAPHEDKIFCKQCHGRKYGPHGFGFGQGAGTLGMDTGERFGNTEAQMSNIPTGNVLSGPNTNNTANIANNTGGTKNTGPKPSGNGCLRCCKPVYHAEKAIGTSKNFHKSCFSCQDCNKKLDSSTMAMHENELYCKGCHGKYFGPSGYGFGQGAGTLSMHQ